MIEELLKYVSVYLISTVKFIGGPLAGMSLGLSYLETVFLTIAGMMTSVFVFSILGRAASRWYSQYRHKRKKPVFSRKSRRIIRIWRNFGVVGVAFFTPLFLTPVFGTIVAAVFGVPRKQIFVHMLWSAIMWSFILTFMVYRFQEAALEYL
ncbi:small multi-drug export protein [uncultured Pontibacter sp.]|uniref:small multi-drug export protein n=1 Tax=uncultured Pontibacter sp. TaxID=453356 RepID=UPI002633E4AD|nr:small multi-drug export protein [uncultured Pontibacter sp.]